MLPAGAAVWRMRRYAASVFCAGAQPVADANGVRLGSIRQQAESEIDEPVQSAAAGDFTRRVALQGKQDFFLQPETSPGGPEEPQRTLVVLINGRLDQRILRDHQEACADLQYAADVSVDQLCAIVQRIAAATGAIDGAVQEIAAGHRNLPVCTEQQAGNSEEAASRIIAAIDGIACQINIPALNASAESVRVGGQGVVALVSEGYCPTPRPACTAKEIRQLSGGPVYRLESGVRLVDDAGRTMPQMTQSVAALGEMARQDLPVLHPAMTNGRSAEYGA